MCSTPRTRLSCNSVFCVPSQTTVKDINSSGETESLSFHHYRPVRSMSEKDDSADEIGRRPFYVGFSSTGSIDCDTSGS